MRIRPAILVAAILLNSAAPTAIAQDALAAPDPNQPAVASLPVCSDQKAMDCIEWAGVVDRQGKYWPATHTRDSVSPVSTDKLGNTVHTGTTWWTAKIPSGDVEYGISANMETPLHARYLLPDGTPHRFGSLWNHITTSKPLETKVRFAVRTSWLRPLHVAMYANEAAFRQIRISGGSRWIFEGFGTAVSYYFSDFTGKYASGAAADADGVSFYFLIDHAGISDAMSPYPVRCADKGYTAMASNATAAGQPQWDATLGSLVFNVGSPHTNTKGEQNFGFFRMWVDEAYIDCQWPGNSLTNSPNLTVQIIDENGNAQAAITVVQRAQGRIYVGASGFHFSQPSVQIRGTEAGSAPTATTLLFPDLDMSAARNPAPAISAQPKSTKKAVPQRPTKVLLCIKGKLVRRITAVNPTCPAGWSRKLS